MTIAEKILARASGQSVVNAGQYVLANIDRVMVIGERMGELTGGPEVLSRWPKDIKLTKVWDADRIVVINEHVAPPDNVNVAEQYVNTRKAVKKFGIRNFFDIGRAGICHQVFCEHGFARPGELVVAPDSHTCTYGAFNVAARGINFELPYVLTFGHTWFRVPETIKIIIHGNLPKGVYSKDIILYIAGLYGSDFALYKSLEIVGSTVDKMSIASRMTIANMGVEIGAKFTLFEADKQVTDYVKQRSNEKFEPVFADKDAKYNKVIEIDVSTLEPQVACPHEVDNVNSVTSVIGKKIDQAFLGSCTNARYEDLEIAAYILKGRKVHPDVRLIITPASELIYIKAMNNGLFDIFKQAGALITHSTCGACAGLQLGVIGPNEVCIGSHNRNFKGRMGSKTSEIYLGSPATVAASSIEGVIADPRPYL